MERFPVNPEVVQWFNYDLEDLPESVKKEKPTLKPMLATLANDSFDDPDWLYEIKWDGYRIVANVEKGKATLRSRELQDYTKKFQAIADDMHGLLDCILDGEIVVLDEEGRPDFSALQNYQGKGDLVYFIFDLLYHEGESYLKRPLVEQKEMLLLVIKKESVLTFSDNRRRRSNLLSIIGQQSIADGYSNL